MVNVNNANDVAALTFEEFAEAYRAIFAAMMSYKLTEVGSDHYCDQLVILAEAHPEWAEQVEAE